MTGSSGKWAIYKIDEGLVRVDFFDPTGKHVVARSTFDKPAIKEFAQWLNTVVSTL